MGDNLVLHTDLYQINMMQVYFEKGISEKRAVFEVYFREMPFKMAMLFLQVSSELSAT